MYIPIGILVLLALVFLSFDDFLVLLTILFWVVTYLYVAISSNFVDFVCSRYNA